jgi:hypothetical protein
VLASSTNNYNDILDRDFDHIVNIEDNVNYHDNHWSQG